MPTTRIGQNVPSVSAGKRSGPPVYHPEQTQFAPLGQLNLNRNPAAPPVYKPQAINSFGNFSRFPQTVLPPAVQRSVPPLPAGPAGTMRVPETGRPSWAPAAGIAVPHSRVKTPEPATGIFARVGATQPAHQRPAAPPVYRPNYSVVAQTYVVPGSRRALPLKMVGQIPQWTIFSATLQMMEDKKRKQKEEKERKKREEQSRVDRSLNALGAYGDLGQNKGIVRIATEDAKKGHLVAHNLGNRTSNTSGKFQNWSEQAKVRANDSTPKIRKDKSDKPKGAYYPPKKEKEEKVPFPKQDLERVKNIAGGQKSREKFLEVYRHQFKMRPSLALFATKMEGWAEKAADDLFGEEDFFVLSEHPSTTPTFRDNDNDFGGPGSGGFGGLGLPGSTTAIDVN